MRFNCLRCGYYEARLKAEPKRIPNRCHHCRKSNLELVGACSGKTTREVPWISKPKRLLIDWIRGGNRGKGLRPGRPKKIVEMPAAGEDFAEEELELPLPHSEGEGSMLLAGAL